MRRLLMAVAAIALVVPAALADDLPEGFWRVSQNFGAVGEGPLALVKVEKKDGKPAVSMAEGTPKNGITVSDLKVDGKTVTLVLNAGGGKFTFEGQLDAKDANAVYGSLSDGSRTFRASLHSQQAGDKFEPSKMPKQPEPMAEVQKLSIAVGQARAKAFQSKDANEKADLQAKVKEAQKELDEKSPALYREVIAKHADSPYAVQAAENLLRQAGKLKPKADEVAKWVKLIEGDAAKYGPKIAADAALQVGETLVAQKDLAAMALPMAEKIEKGIKDTDPLAIQSRALKLLVAAEKAAGKTNAATEARLAKIETKLDEEYVKKVPPFTPEKFAGRKDKEANRVVVMELFTGAQCPPCVAADAAFDGLEKAYTDKDLILIQYHMHIPGPDPLTNPDTIARWDYYTKKFPQKMGGVPSSLFNGKPQSGGGGGMPQSEKKFNDYREIIDKGLEDKSDIKFKGSAKRTGDKIDISVNVDGVKDATDDMKLRLVLIEEKVKYVGGNGMRFHHHVVRALPGGAAGTSLKDKAASTATVDLAEVKKGLTSYLDKFVEERGPFPNPDRPMEMAHLKVIALVQNDATGEILNATEFEVEGK